MKLGKSRIQFLEHGSMKNLQSPPQHHRGGFFLILSCILPTKKSTEKRILVSKQNYPGIISCK